MAAPIPTSKPRDGPGTVCTFPRDPRAWHGPIGPLQQLMGIRMPKPCKDLSADDIEEQVNMIDGLLRETLVRSTRMHDMPWDGQGSPPKLIDPGDGFPYTHAFASHNWGKCDDGITDNHELVSKIVRGLEKFGWKIWLDANGLEGGAGMQGDTQDSMTTGISRTCISRTCVALVFITKRYVDKISRGPSDNCSIEFSTIRNQRGNCKDIIPICLESFEVEFPLPFAPTESDVEVQGASFGAMPGPAKPSLIPKARTRKPGSSAPAPSCGGKARSGSPAQLNSKTPGGSKAPSSKAAGTKGATAPSRPPPSSVRKGSSMAAPPPSRQASPAVPPPGVHTVPIVVKPRAPLGPALGIPDYWVCRIKNTLMEDPVFASDGYTYERSAIEEHLETSTKSPTTGHELETTTLKPDHLAFREIVLSNKFHPHDPSESRAGFVWAARALAQPDEVPNYLRCPITGELMEDPVFASDGYTYERSAIEKHLKSSNKSPKSSHVMETTTLIKNNCAVSELLKLKYPYHVVEITNFDVFRELEKLGVPVRLKAPVR